MGSLMCGPCWIGLKNHVAYALLIFLSALGISGCGGGSVGGQSNAQSPIITSVSASMLRMLMHALQLFSPPEAAATAPSVAEFFVQK